MSRHVHLHSYAPLFQASTAALPAAARLPAGQSAPLFISSTPLAATDHQAHTQAHTQAHAKADTPADQAAGLRRLFAHTQVRFVPLAANPHVAFAGVVRERLCAALAEQGAQVLVVDASEQAAPPGDDAPAALVARIAPFAPGVSVLSARGLPLRYLDAHGCTTGFLDAVSAAAPHADVVLVHASAADLCRMFMRFYGRCEHTARPRPLLLADDHPASVTHAYAAMKLLTHRAGLMVHDLLLCAAPASPRSERIAMQLATCADDFLGAVLRDWMQIDPAGEVPRHNARDLRTDTVTDTVTDTNTDTAATQALRRWVRDTLKPDPALGWSLPAGSPTHASLIHASRIHASPTPAPPAYTAPAALHAAAHAAHACALN